MAPIVVNRRINKSRAAGGAWTLDPGLDQGGVENRRRPGYETASLRNGSMGRITVVDGAIRDAPQGPNGDTKILKSKKSKEECRKSVSGHSVVIVTRVQLTLMTEKKSGTTIPSKPASNIPSNRE